MTISKKKQRLYWHKILWFNYKVLEGHILCDVRMEIILDESYR